MDSNTPQSVCFVITKFTIGGAQETVLALAKSLIDDGWAVTIITGRDGLGIEGDLIGDAKAAGIDVVIAGWLRRRPSPADAMAVVSLYLILRKLRPAIVHTHSSKAGIVGRIAARAAGTPAVVHTAHGWSFHEGMPTLVRWVMITIERLLARITDVVVVVSLADRTIGEELCRIRPRGYQLIRSGIEVEAYAASASVAMPKNTPRIGTVTRFASQKDPDTFLRAAAIVSSNRRDAIFEMVGTGPLLASAEVLAETLDISDRVSFAGPSRDVAAVLTTFSVFCLTSIWEGLPRVLLEAAAAGVPIVATNLPGVREVIEDEVTGLLVPVRSPEAVAHAVLRLLEDPDLSAKLAAAARLRLEPFTARRMVESSTKLYSRLIGSMTP